MNYPNLNYGNKFRFTLYEVINPEDGERKEQNLNQKYTREGLDSFQKKVAEDPEVTLEEIDQYEVQVEEVESRVHSLRKVIGHETEAEHAF